MTATHLAAVKNQH